jgi:type II secretory pathway component GspD/PulD (secretin)
MTRKRMTRKTAACPGARHANVWNRAIALLAAVLMTAAVARADDLVTEVLPIGYRDAGELLSVLRPLVPAPGSVNAFGGQLVVRTDRANLESLRAVLLELDRPPVNLMISVRRTVDEQVLRDVRSAGVRLGREGLSVDARASRRSTTLADDEVQQIRTLEGREAFIRTGESVPVPERQVTVYGSGVITRDSVEYEDFTSGIWVRPRVNGNQVTLDILGQRRELPQRGSTDLRASVDEVSTSVSGQIGRWMELAGSSSRRSSSGGGSGGIRRTQTRSEQGVYVKVERLQR